MIIASKHFPRIITGAVLVSVLGTALYLSGPYLFGLLLLFTLVGLWEFYAMFWPLKANIGGRILGLVLGVMAQLGDFFESALKRSRSVKDSGNVLPGHGGVLDRVDSLLFVIPTYECARALMTFF